MQPKHKTAGFTLIELLTVMAILMSLMVVTAPGLKGTLDSLNLTGATDIARGQLSVARQTAMTRNIPVELRIYNTGGNSSPVWNVMAAVIPSSVSGKADEWIVPGQNFPGNIIISSSCTSANTYYSTIISVATSGSNTPPSSSNPNPTGPWLSGTKEAASAPYAVRNLPYCAFRFQPDGSTDLQYSLTSWSITLYNPYSAPVTSGSFPALNYAALIIDSLTGRTLVYRP